MPMDNDFMLNYFIKAVQPEWEELLKTPRYQPAASKRDAIEREFFRIQRRIAARWFGRLRHTGH